jgi:hypothetical protein
MVVAQPVGNLVVQVFTAGVQETLVAFVLVDHVKHAFVRTIGPIKDLTLPVQDEFLEVQCNGLRYAKIFCILGNDYPHLFTDPEKMVDRMPAGKNDGRKSGNFNFLFSEIFGRHPFDSYKRMKGKRNMVFPFKVKIGRFFGIRSGLRYQDVPDDSCLLYLLPFFFHTLNRKILAKVRTKYQNRLIKTL